MFLVAIPLLTVVFRSSPAPRSPPPHHPHPPLLKNTGAQLTKLQAAKKAQLEGRGFKQGGQRSAVQVGVRIQGPGVSPRWARRPVVRPWQRPEGSWARQKRTGACSHSRGASRADRDGTRHFSK